MVVADLVAVDTRRSKFTSRIGTVPNPGRHNMSTPVAVGAMRKTNGRRRCGGGKITPACSQGLAV